MIKNPIDRAYYERNKEEILKRQREKYLENKEKKAQYRKENKEQLDNWYRTNKERLNEYHRNRVRVRKQTDEEFRFRCNLRSKIHRSIFGAKKSAKTTELLGCSIVELKRHLENLFKEGMSWENYGFQGWHIDHIRPCASFDLTDPEQQKLCWNYSNLQPLWAKDNWVKGDKYTQEGINESKY